MENLNFTETLEDGLLLTKGFSRDQINNLSKTDIDELYYLEFAGPVERGEEKPNGDQAGKEEGPRPPKEEEFPDEEKEELFSEVSDPEKKD